MLDMLQFVKLTNVPAILAQQAEESSLSWFHMFLYSGDWFGLMVIWVLVILSVVSIGFALQQTLRCRRHIMLPPETLSEVETLLEQKLYQDAINRAQRDTSYLGVLITAALSEANNGYPAMQRAAEETADAEATRMLRPIEYLNVVGNVSPMVGLFGTVYGMIRAFQTLVESGGTPDAGKLAAGISTALVTTFWGLVVAIPALTAYALVRNKIDAQATEALVIVDRLLSPFKPHGGHGPYIAAGSTNLKPQDATPYKPTPAASPSVSPPVSSPAAGDTAVPDPDEPNPLP